jgi:hypothetical protein
VDPKNRQELDALFAKRAEGQRSAAQAAEIRRVRQEAFVDRFYKARGEVMEPAMQAFGDYLRSMDFEFEVTTEDRMPANAGHRVGPISASITISFAPKGKLRAWDHSTSKYPKLTLSCNEVNEAVSIYECAMWGGSGSAGPGGEAPLDTVTAKFVEDRLTALVKRVLAR